MNNENLNQNLVKNDNQIKNHLILQEKYFKLNEYNEKLLQIHEEIHKDFNNFKNKNNEIQNYLNLINILFKECIEFNEFWNYSSLESLKKERNLNRFKIIHYHYIENFEDFKNLINKYKKNNKDLYNDIKDKILEIFNYKEKIWLENKNFLNKFKVAKENINLETFKLDDFNSSEIHETKKNMKQDKKYIILISIFSLLILVLSILIIYNILKNN